MRISDLPVSQTTLDSPDYPEQLKQLPDPPKQLYYRGTWDKSLFEKSLAVVGSRRATSYSERALGLLMPSLVAQGVTIVSGFMYGIDSLAHRQCLDCGGRTVAVLGGGLNVLYPPDNEGLYREVIKEGLIISEYPPGQRPQLWTFVQRNRIVAGLSTLGVLVVEAGEKSGSLVTARLALRLGKPLFALPGPITSSASVGTNELIKDGLAKMVLGAEDILPPTGPIPARRSGNKTPLRGDSLESQILTLLAAEPLTLDDMALKLQADVVKLGQTLTMMSLRGKITEDHGKYALTGS